MPDFIDIKIRKTVIKLNIKCEYTIGDVDSLNSVRDNIEQALDVLRYLGSADPTYETDAQEIVVPARRDRARRLPRSRST